MANKVIHCRKDRVKAIVSRFLLDFTRALYRPQALYAEIKAGRESPSYLCVLIYCLVYVVGTLWLYLRGFTPFVEAWIKIDPRSYYLIEAFYLTPLVFLMWIMGAGSIHVLSQLFGGDGDFDRIFQMTGYSLWAPLYLLAVVDVIHATPDWLYNMVLLVSMVLVIYGTSTAAVVEYRLNRSASLVIALSSSASVGVILFTYIR